MKRCSPWHLRRYALRGAAQATAITAASGSRKATKPTWMNQSTRRTINMDNIERDDPEAGMRMLATAAIASACSVFWFAAGLLLGIYWN